MLSLMVNEALQGVDISKRYPSFYKKLLTNTQLREAFVDSLEALDTQVQEALAPSVSQPALGFLEQSVPQTQVTHSGEAGWRIRWRETIEQLQAIFTPSELVYRSDPSLYDDPWFTLLRDETRLDELSLTVVLECAVSQVAGDALACVLNVALRPEGSLKESQNGLQATLQWGEYSQQLPLKGQGRWQFPDIPFKAIFDTQGQSIDAPLQLTLETLSS